MFEQEHLSWTAPSAPSAGHPRVDVAAIIELVRPVAVANIERLESGEISDELVDVLWESGVFRGQMPRSLGGLEMHPVDWLDMIYELSRINGSLGWLAAILSGGFDLRPPEVMQRLLADGRRWLASGSGPGGAAVRTEGGYRVTGSWRFVSGIPIATFASGMVLLSEADGSPIVDPDTGQQMMRSAMFPIEDVEVDPDFDALGMRGSGSGGFSAKDAFVPDDVMYPVMGMPPEYAALPLYKEIFIAMGHAAHALGLARAAIDAYVDTAHRKAAKSDGPSGFGDAQYDQIALAKADAMIRAGRLLAWDATANSFDDAFVNDPITYDLRVRFTQANTFATRIAYEAMLMVYEAAGTSGVMTGSRLEQVMRDLSTVVQHGLASDKNHDTVGQYLITRDMPGGPMIDTFATVISGPHPVPASA